MIVGLYARVSTDEQKKYGLSVAQQVDDLQKWADENNVVVYDLYIDEGKSASNLKRPELQRLISDIQAKRVEKLVCTKLDRLSRKPRDYYRFMDMIEPYGGGWQTIQEDYDTETTNGQFLINIKMAMAEAELNATSDRIRAVFKGKKERGEICTGCVAKGLKVDGKHLVIDLDNVKAIEDLFDSFEQVLTISGGMRLYNEWGYDINISSYRRMLSNEIYAGRRHGKDDYCPAIIAPERFDHIQEMLALCFRTSANNDRVYIFSGLLRCGECGLSYVSAVSTHKNVKGESISKKYYRCSGISTKGFNKHNSSIPEAMIEKYLLSSIRELLNEHITNIEIESSNIKKKNISVDSIDKKIERLQEVYIDGAMSKEKYSKKLKELQEQRLHLQKEKDPYKDLTALKSILDQPIENIYSSLSETERRTLWFSVIDHIDIMPKEDLNRKSSPERIKVYFRK